MADTKPDMSEVDLAPFEEAFKEISGGDDKITHDDLKKALEKGGVKASDNDIKQFIEMADVEGTGYISFEEFCRVVIGMTVMRIIGALRALFDAADEDKDGKITADELKEVIEKQGTAAKVPQETIDELVAKCDEAGDGKVDFEQFLEGLAANLEEGN